MQETENLVQSNWTKVIICIIHFTSLKFNSFTSYYFGDLCQQFLSDFDMLNHI